MASSDEIAKLEKTNAKLVDDWTLSTSTLLQDSMCKADLLSYSLHTGVATKCGKNEFIQVTFPEPIKITGLVLGNPSEIINMDDDCVVDVQYSHDGFNWIKAYDITISDYNEKFPELVDLVHYPKLQYFRLYSPKTQHVATSFMKFYSD